MIAPRFKKSNLLISGDTHSRLHPYVLIQANEMQGYIWGRPEIADLIEPQGLLSTWCDDTRRLYGLQIDKILAFSADCNRLGKAGQSTGYALSEPIVRNVRNPVCASTYKSL